MRPVTANRSAERGSQRRPPVGDELLRSAIGTPTDNGETGVVPVLVLTLTVHNTGGTLHNVSIPSQKIDQDVAPGETIQVTVDAGPTAFQ